MSFSLADALKGVSDLGTGRKQIEYVQLDLIDEDEDNFYALSEIEKLANNIATIGLQQPLVLRPSHKVPGRYITVSGHRRRAALLLLVKEDPDRWREVPCIVDPDAVSPYLQELKLIFGNADTRKMSNADLDKQAQRVEELLYKLKEEGYEFPGRMRDHVAQAVGASKSKLARLRVIRENLASCWADAWKNGTIGESVAYNLSQMPKSWQTVIYTVWGDKADKLYADTVSNSKERFKKVCEIQCKHGLNICEHTVIMMQKDCKAMYSTPCTGCCFDCASLQTCKDCCPQARGKQKEMKATAKQAAWEDEERQKERDRPGAEFARMVWDRIGKARQQSGCTIEALVLARGDGVYSASIDDPKQEKMETGRGEYTKNNTVSLGYGIRACDAMRIVAVADALHCSIDYLLGRTDRMNLAPEMDAETKTEDVPKSDTIWHPISEEPPTGIDLVWVDGQGYSDTGVYYGGQTIELNCTVQWPEARWWAMPPEE